MRPLSKGMGAAFRCILTASSMRLANQESSIHATWARAEKVVHVVAFITLWHLVPMRDGSLPYLYDIYKYAFFGGQSYTES